MLIDTPTVDLSTTGEGEPPAAAMPDDLMPDRLMAELAWCLGRFVTGRADEPAMRRAEQALADWRAWSGGVTVELSG